MLNDTLKDLRTAIIAFVGVQCAAGARLPAAITGIAQVVFPGQADGSLVKRDGEAVGSSLVGQNFAGAAVLPPAAIGRRRRRLRRAALLRLEPRAVEPGARRPRRGRPGAAFARRTACSADARDPGRCRHGLGERPRPAHLARVRRPAGRARRARTRRDGGRGARPGREAHRRLDALAARRAARQRAAAEPRAGRAE